MATTDAPTKCAAPCPGGESHTAIAFAGEPSKSRNLAMVGYRWVYRLYMRKAPAPKMQFAVMETTRAVRMR